MKNSDWEPDDRLKPLDLFFPPEGPPLYPVGTVGISLVSDKENLQEDLFLHCDPNLIAVHFEGDVKMASLVCDMAPEFKVDPTRKGRLHSVFRVVKEPRSPCVDYHEQNTVALNFVDSLCGDTHGGLYADIPTGDTSNPDPDPVPTPGGGSGGKVGQTVAGPSQPSQVGQTQAGGQKRAFGALSYVDSGPNVAGSDSDKHRFGVDADGDPLISGHLHTNSYFRRDNTFDAPLHFEGIWVEPSHGTRRTYVHLEYDGSMSHPWVCQPRNGMWRWWAETDWYPIEPPGQPVPPTVPPTDPKRPGTPRETSSDGIWPVAPRTPPEETWWVIGSTVEDNHIAMSFRPQPVYTGAPDFRHTRGRDDSLFAWYDKYAPVVCRLEPWGKQQGSVWDYTEDPGASRYVGGTAPGGLMLFSPEIEIVDILDTHKIEPPERTISKSYLAVARVNAYFGSGIPDVATGALLSGYRWTTDASGNLNFERLDSSAVAVDCTRMAAGARPKLQAKLGTSTDWGNVVTRVGLNITSAGTAADLVETVLGTVTLKANSLGAVGEGVRVKAWGTVAANANAKTIRLRFGGIAGDILVSNDVTGSPNGVDWELDAHVYFASPANQEAIAEGQVGSVLQSKNWSQPRQDETANIDVSLTGQNDVATADDIVFKGMIVEMLT